MCGIAGALDRDVDRAASRVAELNAGQRHRGPDHEVVVRAGAFTLGNNRLAIQDPTPSGNQPFWSADRRYVCVFNGEIYNHLELIDEFGLDLRNRCDGAVIPELWSRLGRKSLRCFRGMYAIALVDTVEGSLTLARDPFGIKPLYLRRLPDGTLAFASEVKPLARLHSLPPVSKEAVATYLYLGSMPADVSPFEGITAVPANTTVAVDGEGRRSQSPILPGEHPLIDTADEDLDLGTAFRESVELHLRSEVPTVLLLSAGVDSTALAAAAREGGHDLTRMTVQGVGNHDEVPEAAATAAHYGHKHELVPAHLDEGSVNRFFEAMQRPTIDGLNTFVVCEAVRRSGYPVALSELGGDEALRGYAHYHTSPWLGVLESMDQFVAAGRMAAAARVPTARSGGDNLARLLVRRGPSTAWELDLLQREVHPAATVRALTGLDPRSAVPTRASDGSRSFPALAEAELANYLQTMLLPDADLFSMFSSVELRVPYLDGRFFANAVSAMGEQPRRVGKRTLADPLADAILGAVLRHPKWGFSVPVTRWVDTGPLKPLNKKVERPEAPVWNFLSPKAAAEVLAGESAGRWSRRWSLLALKRWLCSLDPIAEHEGVG